MKTAHSTKDLPDAVADLKLQYGTRRPRIVVVFGSTKYDPAALSRQMRQAFPHSCVIGCSTAGEIDCGEMLSGSLVALFLDDEIVEDAASAVVENLSSGVQIDAAFSRMARHFGAAIPSLDISRHVGLVITDGMSGAEERLLETLGDRTDMFFVGGSAGDDLKFQSTHVLHNGAAHTNAAVLLILRLKRGFDIVKTQSFQPIGKTLLATKVDEPKRTVIEFNHKPALAAYAEALGLTQDEASARFFEHPLGLMVGSEPFVRSPQRADGGSLVFYCQIKEDTELEVLQATDIVADTRAAVAASQAAGAIHGLIDFQCILRTLQLRNENRCQQYGEIFHGFPMAGFSTYGEAYLGHMNQTSTMLLFR
ncbi:conserved hypothetical protein [Candidatus Sulfopaludibacter sp. SbA3]|nr:conserved hypothetical protein [Candidatus Sulfopaludibacter sp. SbA3]